MDELLELLGIDEDGNIRPEVIALALADAAENFPVLYRLLTARLG